MAAGSPSQPSPPLEIDCSHPGQSKSTISSTFLIPQALQSSTTTSAKQNITTTFVGDFIIPLNTTATLTPNGHNKVPTNVDGFSHKATYSEVVKGQPTHISYADLVKGKSDSGSFKDPDVPILKLPTLTSTFQGKPAVLFPSTAKSLLVKRLKFVLVGKFSHGRPSLRSVKLFFVKLQLIGTINITVYDNKHIFLECSCKEDFYRIWLGLTWFIEGLAMRVFKWFPDFSPLKESSIAPVWINVAGLPLYMFEKSSLMSIAEAAGSPIRVDPRNINRSIVNTAWICIELDVQKNLVEDVWVSFVDDSGKDQLDGFWIKFSYTVVPPFCSFCQHIGHKSDFCKRKAEQIPQESRPDLSSEVAAVPVADAVKIAGDEIAMEYANGEAAAGELTSRKLFIGVPAGYISIPAGETAAGDVFATTLEGAPGDRTAGTNASAAGMDWSWLAAGPVGIAMETEERSATAAGMDWSVVPCSAATVKYTLQNNSANVHTANTENSEEALQEVTKNSFATLEEEVLVKDITLEEGVLVEAPHEVQVHGNVKDQHSGQQPPASTHPDAVAVNHASVVVHEGETNAQLGDGAAGIKPFVQELRLGSKGKDEKEEGGFFTPLSNVVVPRFTSPSWAALAEEEEKEEQIRIVSQLSPSEVTEYARKEMEKIWNPPTRVAQVLDTSPSNPYILDKEGRPVPCSEVIRKSMRLAIVRSYVDKVKQGNTSPALKEKAATLKEKWLYDKLMHMYTEQIRLTIKDHQQTISSKDTSLRQEMITHDSADEKD